MLVRKLKRKLDTTSPIASHLTTCGVDALFPIDFPDFDFVFASFGNYEIRNF